jgi:hypothetical protein
MLGCVRGWPGARRREAGPAAQDGMIAGLWVDVGVLHPAAEAARGWVTQINGFGRRADLFRLTSCFQHARFCRGQQAPGRHTYLQPNAAGSGLLAPDSWLLAPGSRPSHRFREAAIQS